jgi:hypothetical protein
MVSTPVVHVRVSLPLPMYRVSLSQLFILQGSLP